MRKNTYIGLVVGLIVTILVAGGGVWYVKIYSNERDDKQQVKKTLGSSNVREDVSQSQQQQNQQSAGLNVDQNTFAASLGQMDGVSQQTNDNPKQASNPFNPKTYAQYERYKNDQSGLFAEAQVGTGDELTQGKKAAVYYRGWLTNGQLFDESKKGEDGQLQPFVFELGAHQVIPGWEQALSGMKVGGVRMVIVPPAAGYGAQAQGSIPPNSVLIFQVQLAAVQ